MKKLLLSAVMISVCSGVWAGDRADTAPWREELARDIVTVNGGTMTMEEGGVLTVDTVEPTKLRVKIQGDAPARGVISRDNFVAVVTSVYHSIFMNLTTSLLPELPAAKLEASYSFRNDANVKRNADVVIAISLDATGLMLQLTNSRNQNVQKFPMTWEQYFCTAESGQAQGAKGSDPAAAKSASDAGAAKAPAQKKGE